MSIHLTAFIKSKPGTTADMKLLLLALVTASKKEEACLQYELYQSADDENLYIFHETWASKEGLEAHSKDTGITTFIKDSAAILDGEIVIHAAARII